MSPSSQPTTVPSGRPSTVPTSAPSMTPVVALYGLWTVGIYLVPMIIIISFTFLADCRETRQLNKDLKNKDLTDLDPSSDDKGRKIIQARVAELIREPKPTIAEGLREIKIVSADAAFGEALQNDKNTMKECYTEIIGTLFYGMFSPNHNFIGKIEAELEANHTYLAVFFSKKIGFDRWLLTAKLTTCLNMGLMLVFILFDFQQPVNNHDCYSHRSEKTCLHKVTPFDPSIFECRWQESQTFPRLLSNCSYNNYASAFTYRSLITITFAVFVIMAPVVTLVEYAFDEILSAPQYSTANSLLLPGNESQELAKQELNVKVATRVKLLRENIRIYRSELDFTGEIDRLNQFDGEWGIYPCDDGEEELLYIDKIVSSIRAAIYKYEKEFIYFETLESETRGLCMLFRFAVDLFGANTPTARIFKKKADPQFKEQTPISYPVKALFAFFLVCANVIALVIPVIVSEGHILYWINAVIEACVLYVVVDFLFIEGGKFLLMHVAIPYQFKEHAVFVYKTMIHALNAMCESGHGQGYANTTYSSKNVETNDYSKFDRHTGGVAFSATDYVFESVSLARSFPKQAESAIVLSHRCAMPGLAGIHWRGEYYTNLFNRVAADEMMNSYAAGTTYRHVQTGERYPFVGQIDRRTITQYADRPVSTFASIRRSFAKYAITIYARCPFYFVRLLLHLLLPSFLGGIVGIVWLLVNTVSVAVYILILITLLCGTSAILYYSQSSGDPSAGRQVNKVADESIAVGDFPARSENMHPVLSEKVNDQWGQTSPSDKFVYSSSQSVNYGNEKDSSAQRWRHEYPDELSVQTGNGASKLMKPVQYSSVFDTPRSSDAGSTGPSASNKPSVRPLQFMDSSKKRNLFGPLELELERLERRQLQQTGSIQADSQVAADIKYESRIGSFRSSPAVPSHPRPSSTSAFNPSIARISTASERQQMAPSPLIQAMNSLYVPARDENKYFGDPEPLSDDLFLAGLNVTPKSLDDIQRMRAELAVLESKFQNQQQKHHNQIAEDEGNSDEEADFNNNVVVRVATPPKGPQNGILDGRRGQSILKRPAQPHRLVVDVSKADSALDSPSSNGSEIPRKLEEVDEALLSGDGDPHNFAFSEHIVNVVENRTTDQYVSYSRHHGKVEDAASVGDPYLSTTNDSATLSDLYRELHDANAKADAVKRADYEVEGGNDVSEISAYDRMQNVLPSSLDAISNKLVAEHLKTITSAEDTMNESGATANSMYSSNLYPPKSRAPKTSPRAGSETVGSVPARKLPPGANNNSSSAKRVITGSRGRL
jgi:hypothetical protein